MGGGVGYRFQVAGCKFGMLRNNGVKYFANKNLCAHF
jgi:nitrite reductase/ring-hydroxylating ferredoxin subunit